MLNKCQISMPDSHQSEFNWEISMFRSFNTATSRLIAHINHITHHSHHSHLTSHISPITHLAKSLTSFTSHIWPHHSHLTSQISHITRIPHITHISHHISQHHMSLFVAGAMVGGVGVALLVGGAMSLFVAGALFGDVGAFRGRHSIWWILVGSAKCCIFHTKFISKALKVTSANGTA